MGAYCGAGQDCDGVPIDQVTSILLADSLGATIERVGRDLLLLTTQLLGAREQSATAMVETLTNACLDEVRLAIGRHTRDSSGRRGGPVGLAFNDVVIYANHASGQLTVEMDGVGLVVRFDFCAGGVVFYVQGPRRCTSHGPAPSLILAVTGRMPRMCLSKPGAVTYCILAANWIPTACSS